MSLALERGKLRQVVGLLRGPFANESSARSPCLLDSEPRISLGSLYLPCSRRGRIFYFWQGVPLQNHLLYSRVAICFSIVQPTVRPLKRAAWRWLGARTLSVEAAHPSMADTSFPSYLTFPIFLKWIVFSLGPLSRAPWSKRNRMDRGYLRPIVGVVSSITLDHK